MDDLVKALMIPFVAGFIVQRFLEIVDPLTAKLFKDPGVKRIVLGFASLIIGWILSACFDLGIFHALKLPAAAKLPDWIDNVFTGIFISAGTEGFNSLLKFVNYKKEESKAEAASRKSEAPEAQLRLLNP